MLQKIKTTIDCLQMPRIAQNPSEICKMLQFVYKCSRLLQNAANMVPHATDVCNMLLIASNAANAVKCCRLLPNAADCYKMLLKYCKMLQLAENAIDCCRIMQKCWQVL